jgi:uncharacterized protein YodC (DUF2158 family)
MQESTIFKPGDSVMLASGSPTLTVVDIGKHTGCILCRWPDDAGKPVEHSFPPEGLRMVRRPQQNQL